MRKTERWFLLSLLAFSVISFLPSWRNLQLAGMSLFGWWMAALMVLSPVGALFIFWADRRRDRRRAEGGS